MSTIIYCHTLLRRFADIRYENQPPPLRGAPMGRHPPQILPLLEDLSEKLRFSRI